MILLVAVAVGITRVTVGVGKGVAVGSGAGRVVGVGAVVGGRGVPVELGVAVTTVAVLVLEALDVGENLGAMTSVSITTAVVGAGPEVVGAQAVTQKANRARGTNRLDIVSSDVKVVIGGRAGKRETTTYIISPLAAQRIPKPEEQVVFLNTGSGLETPELSSGYQIPYWTS